jgi:uncharacterized membrane protein
LAIDEEGCSSTDHLMSQSCQLKKGALLGHVQVSRLIPAPIREVFQHITDFSNLPDWVSVGSESFSSGIEVDFPVRLPETIELSEMHFLMSRFGIQKRIVVRVSEVKPFERFSYFQVNGVFRHWSHTQTLREHGENLTLVTDLVDYKLPGWVVGALFDDLVVRRDVEMLLAQRLSKIEKLMLANHRSPE